MTVRSWQVVVAMADLVSDITGAAAQVARALRASGYRSDFSSDSLWDIEAFFREHTQGGAPRRGGLLTPDTGARLFALGGYIGEVIRRERGGEWVADDADEAGEINIALRLADGSLCWPVQRAMKRVSSGDSESIVIYGRGLGLPVGSKPVTNILRRVGRFLANGR